MKNILILGSSGGMGQEIVKKFIDNGFNVYGIDVKPFNYANFRSFEASICDERSIIRVYEQIASEIDSIYAIVSVVGIYVMDSLLEISDDELKNIIDINVLGIIRTIRIFYPLLKKDSRILITTSELSTYDPLPFNGIYSMTKSLLEKYAFSLLMEVNQFGIKVITYRPGAVKTPLLNQSTTSIDKFIEKTSIHKNASKRFKKIVDSVETKAISTKENAAYIYKIISLKNPRLSYAKNRNLGLVLLNILPRRLQIYIITKVISK